MLPLSRFRDTLRVQGKVSEDELTVSREQFYLLADLVVERLSATRIPDKHAVLDEENYESRAAPTSALFASALAVLSPVDREATVERAAILEFDGGLDRRCAEMSALRIYFENQCAFISENRCQETHDDAEGT